MRVFVLESKWDLGENTKSDVMGVFDSKEKAQQEMLEAFKYDIENTYFSRFFKDGKLLPNCGVCLEMRDMQINLFEECDYPFIEYRINEYKVL